MSYEIKNLICWIVFLLGAFIFICGFFQGKTEIAGEGLIVMAIILTATK